MSNRFVAEDEDIIYTPPTIALYSHGFGVLKDNRGMFNDIKKAFPEFYKHCMLDMNKFDKEKNELTVTPLDQQAKLLARFVERKQRDYPDSRFILFCHSQGCLVASMAKIKGMHKVILIAPPSGISGASNKIKEMLKREGTVILEDGSIKYPRRDGTTTLVSRKYLDSREGVDPLALYSDLAKNNPTVLIRATEDEVLGETNFSKLDQQLKIVDVPGTHDFNGEYRQELLKALREIFYDS